MAQVLYANIDYGIRLILDRTERFPFIVDYPDTVAPIGHTAQFVSLSEAISWMVDFMLNPEVVYSMDDLSDEVQNAYQTVSDNPDARNAAYIFVYSAIMGTIPAYCFG